MTRTCILWSLLFALARADPEVPGDEFLDPRARQPSDYWLRQNAVSLYREQVVDDDRYYTWGFPSYFQTTLNLRALRFSYQHGKSLWMDLGTQRAQLDPFVAPLILQGGRLTLDMDALRIDAALGKTTEYNLPLAILGEPEFQVNSLAFSTRLASHGYARLSTSGWSPVDGRTIRPGFRVPQRSRTVALEIRPDVSDFVDNLNLWGGYGIELASQAPGLSAQDRRAYGWRLDFQSGGLQINAQEDNRGLAYGPGHNDNFSRGQANLSLNGAYDLTPELQARESYNRFSFRNPVEALGNFATTSEFLTHSLNYHSQNGEWLGTVSYSTGGSSSALGLSTHQSSQLAQLQWHPERNLSFLATHLKTSSQSAGGGTGFNSLFPALTQTTRDDLAVDWQLSPTDGVVMRLGQSRLQGSGISSGGPSFGITYRKLFPDDQGALTLDYLSTNYGFSPTTNLRAGLQYRPSERWRIGADYTFYDAGSGANAKLTGESLDLSYLIDPHNEVSLIYRNQPYSPLINVAIPNITNLQTYVGLELRQSWNGPLEKQFEARLRPSVRVEVLVHAPGDTLLLPVEGARLLVNQELVGKTDGQGRLRIRPAEGLAQVRLDLSQAGPYYELEGSNDNELRLGEGADESLAYHAVGYAGIQVVTWNDFFASGQLPTGYVPVPDVPLTIDGKSYTTNALGQLSVARLDPGHHQVLLSRALLPPGLEALTQDAFEVDVAPGQSAQIDVPLRGFAIVRGQVKTLGGVRIPPGGLTVTTNGNALGTTSEDGRFELKVPSGALRLGLDLNRLPGGAFVVEMPAFKLAPGQVRDLTMLVSLKGRIQVQLSQNGQPLTLSGVPIEIEGIPFRYSNRMGRAEFPEVPPGAYRVSISPESLPKGVRLGVHANQTVNLQPGQTLEINLELEKK